MASRFALGVVVGLGGSFAILQRTTDRRIISLMRTDDEQKSASIYQYRLYRKISDFARPLKEGETEKKAKAMWNSGVKGISGAFNTLGSLFSPKTEEKPAAEPAPEDKKTKAESK